MIHEAFVAPFWLASTHLQSMGAVVPLWAPPASFRPGRVESLRIPLPSGGALHARAWWQEGAREGLDEAAGADALSRLRRAPAAVIVHGVGGSNASSYVVRAGVSMHRAGWHVVRLDLRGAGDSIPDARELYHAGLTEDLRVALEHIGARAHVDGSALVGFSLGGHVALRLAGELGDRAPGSLRAVVAISAPLDLVKVTRAIERLRSFPYQHHVLRSLVRQATAFALFHPERARYDARALARLRTIRAYDAEVIAPMHGFASAEDYYERVSAGPLLECIRLPTLLVHAEDDPLVPAETVRSWLRAAPRALEQAWTRRGGHVGWFAGLSESSWVDTWAMQRALGFVRGLVGGLPEKAASGAHARPPGRSRIG
jgi:uncharacterized protein